MTFLHCNRCCLSNPPQVTHLTLEADVVADSVGVSASAGLGAELLRIDSETPRELDTGPQGLGVSEVEETFVVDLGLCVTKAASGGRGK